MERGGPTNLWGVVPEVVEMQSEAGAAGTLHGASLNAALATTFTASQGLLLMIPNMYKIAGELTPAVIHVAARTVATHALSIFGDHSDVMAARPHGLGDAAPRRRCRRPTTWPSCARRHAALPACRSSTSSTASAPRTRWPRFAASTDADLRALIHEDALLAHRARGLDPDRPVLRGTAQNPDVFFQAREASNIFYDSVPTIVQGVMDELADRTGRQYHLVDYRGAPTPSGWS